MAAEDESALRLFYDLTSRRVYGLVLCVLKDSALAEEVTLDVYLQVWREAPQFSSDRGSPLAWLLTLTRSRAIDRLRKIRAVDPLGVATMPAETSVAVSPAADQEASADERARHVQAALARLGPEQRQVLVLSYFQGLSHSEIAAQLALPLGTVKTRIRAGMAYLHELLSSHFGGNVFDE
jgi:RNA polymerase sigma-70 factor (ECF subfamily)